MCNVEINKCYLYSQRIICYFHKPLRRIVVIHRQPQKYWLKPNLILYTYCLNYQQWCLFTHKKQFLWQPSPTSSLQLGGNIITSGEGAISTPQQYTLQEDLCEHYLLTCCLHVQLISKITRLCNFKNKVWELLANSGLGKSLFSQVLITYTTIETPWVAGERTTRNWEEQYIRTYKNQVEHGAVMLHYAT